MRVLVLIIICCLFDSCLLCEGKNVNKQEITLPGKIAVQLNDTCFIYDNSFMSGAKFKIRDDKKIRYSGFKWVNGSDYFVGVEFFATPATGTNQGNIVCFDLSGNIVKRIYDSQNGEITGYPYLSRNDKRLLFTTETKADSKINPFEGLSHEQSIVIMDYSKKEVTKKIEKIGLSSNLELHESPWLYDENRFIYSISGDKKILVEGTRVNPVQEDQPGVYVYDLSADQKKLLVPGARFGVCSPVDLRICYIKDHSIWVMDLKDNSIKNICKVGSKEEIGDIHWTPDGKYIYIVYFKHGLIPYLSDKSGEKLIKVSTSKEISFKKIGHGFHSYTWK